MEVTVEHIPDSGEGFDNGFIVYNFIEDGQQLFGSQHDSELDEAHFMHWHEQNGRFHKFHAIPYDNALFVKAIKYFQDQHNVIRLHILIFTQKGISPTWQSISLDKLTQMAVMQ